MSEVLVGKVARATESRHATGAEKEIPDIREYSKGAPGYFQRWDPHSGTVAGRGRAFLLGKPPDELAYMKRIVAARQHLRDWSIPDLPPLALDDGQAEAATAGAADATAQQITGMRGRLASITSRHPAPAPADSRPLPGKGPLPAVPGVPQKVMAVLYPLLASGRTISRRGRPGPGRVEDRRVQLPRRDADVRVRRGHRKRPVLRLAAPRTARSARRQAGRGRSAHRGPGDHQPSTTTLEDLAQAAHDGLVDVDEDTRDVLEEVRRIAGRKRLSVVPSPPDDDGE